MADPTCSVEEGGATLVRRLGLFWRETVALDDVFEVVAVSRDALTHEAIDIHFRSGAMADFQLTEFDIGFRATVSMLAERFPGLERWQELAVGEAFARRERVLWRREGRL